MNRFIYFKKADLGDEYDLGLIGGALASQMSNVAMFISLAFGIIKDPGYKIFIFIYIILSIVLFFIYRYMRGGIIYRQEKIL